MTEAHMDKKRADRVAQHINEKWKDKDCLLCGENQWGLADVRLSCLDRPDHGLPLIAVTCGNCGNTVLISAVAAGVYESEDKPTS